MRYFKEETINIQHNLDSLEEHVPVKESVD